MAESDLRLVRDVLLLFLLLFLLWIALDFQWWGAAALTAGHLLWRAFTCLMVCAAYIVARWWHRS